MNAHLISSRALRLGLRLRLTPRPRRSSRGGIRIGTSERARRETIAAAETRESFSSGQANSGHSERARLTSGAAEGDEILPGQPLTKMAAANGSFYAQLAGRPLAFRAL